MSEVKEKAEEPGRRLKKKSGRTAATLQLRSSRLREGSSKSVVTMDNERETNLTVGIGTFDRFQGRKGRKPGRRDLRS